MEVWIFLKRFPRYEVSNLGRVRRRRWLAETSKTFQTVSVYTRLEKQERVHATAAERQHGQRALAVHRAPCVESIRRSPAKGIRMRPRETITDYRTCIGSPQKKIEIIESYTPDRDQSSCLPKPDARPLWRT